MLPLQKKHVSLEGVTRRRLSSLRAFKIGDLVALTAKGQRASIKVALEKKSAFFDFKSFIKLALEKKSAFFDFNSLDAFKILQGF